MFERLRAGWLLAKSVRYIVSGDRGLLIYPIISGIAGTVLFVAAFVAAFMIPVTAPTDYRVFAGIFFAYLVTAFVTTYFLLAMLIAFKSYEAGEKIGIGESLSRARPYTARALEWALFYTILVMLLRVIESRFRGIAQILIAGAGSIGITVATFFAVPAILEKKVGPIEASKESIGTIRRTIGPVFGGVGYIDLYTLVFVLGGIFIAVAGGFLVPILAAKIAVVAFGVILVVVGMVLNFTYFNIFKLILYDYFNGSPLPEGVDETTLQTAIKRRRKLL